MRQIADTYETVQGDLRVPPDTPPYLYESGRTRPRTQPLVAPGAGRTGIMLVLVAMVSCCTVGCVTQSTGAYDGAMTITVENDVFTGSDNNYTNGVGATWNSNEIHTYDDDSFVRKWADFWSFLPFVSNDGYHTYAAWSVGQEMYTPNDIKVANPPEDDEPYAGVLYVDNLLYARRDRTEHAWSLKVGVVGPASQAEDTQKWFHRVIGADKPMGWDTQLPNEPIVNLGYSVAHLWVQGDVGKTASWRLVPVGTVALGNYFTGAAAGMYGEVGWNLVDALGTTALRSGFNAASTAGIGPVNGWSVAFIGGLGGYGVAHWLPLDGTVFHDSRSVDSKPFIGTGTIGLSVRHHGLTLSLTRTFFTETFDTERAKTQFGTLSVSWYF